MQKGIFKKMTAFVMTLCMVLSSFAIVPAAETGQEEPKEVQLELQAGKGDQPNEIKVSIVIVKNNVGYYDTEEVYHGYAGTLQLHHGPHQRHV